MVKRSRGSGRQDLPKADPEDFMATVRRGARVDDFHGAAAEDEGGADHDGVAQLLRDHQCLLLRHHHVARRLLDVQPRQDLVPLVAVL